MILFDDKFIQRRESEDVSRLPTSMEPNLRKSLKAFCAPAPTASLPMGALLRLRLDVGVEGPRPPSPPSVKLAYLCGGAPNGGVPGPAEAATPDPLSRESTLGAVWLVSKSIVVRKDESSRVSSWDVLDTKVSIKLFWSAFRIPYVWYY